MQDSLALASRRRAEAGPAVPIGRDGASRPIEIEPGIRLLEMRTPLSAPAPVDALVLSTADAGLLAAVALRMAAVDRPLRYQHLALDGALLGALADGRHGWPSFVCYQLDQALRRHRHRRLIVVDRCATTVSPSAAVSTELGPVRLCRAFAGTYPALPIELLRLRGDGRLAADPAARLA